MGRPTKSSSYDPTDKKSKVQGKMQEQLELTGF